MNDQQKRIEIIEKKCKDNGLKIETVFRKADIPKSTIANWRKSEPAAFSTFDKVMETIEEMIRDEKQQTA